MIRQIFVIAIGICCCAADEVKYPPARTLLERRESEARHAEEIYVAALASADKRLVADAEIAIKRAMTSNSLEGANEISQIKKEAIGRIAHEASLKSPEAVYGHWRIRCNAGEWNWDIAPGRVTHERAAGASNSAELHGSSLVVKWADGAIERFTAVNDRLLFESWPDGGDMSDMPPRFGVGVRTK